MSAQDILKECSELIDERGKTYGDFDSKMNDIAYQFKLFTGLGYEICKAAQFNFAQKIVRMESSKMKHRDSCMDAIAYLAEYIHLMDKDEGWQ